MTLGDPEVRAQLPVRKAPKHVSAAVPGDRLMLSELIPAQTEGAFSLMVRDLNWQGEPIALGGKTYASGICVNTWDGANGAEFDLSGVGWKRLRGLVGIELWPEDKVGPQQKDNTKVVFVVKGDGKELFRSQPFVWGSTTPEALDVDVSEVRVLRLEVLTTGSSFDAVYSADWVELRLER